MATTREVMNAAPISPPRRLPAARLASFRGAASRLGQLLVVVAGVSFLTFILLNLLPGDPAVAVLGDNATDQSIANFRARHDLDRPILVRYVDWVSGVVRLDFGTSYRNERDVFATITNRLPVSLQLVVMAQVVALGAAIPAARLAVRRQNTVVDRAVNVTSFAALSIPSFLIAYLLILIFAVRLQWFPATGFRRISDGLGENLRSATLPALTLAVSQFAVYTRLLRNDMIETLSQGFVTTAYGKGISDRRVHSRHVFRGSLLSLVTVVGVNMGALLGGAIITETIFGVPGIGRLLIEAIQQRDLMMVQGVVMFIAASYVVINLAVDVLYSFLDPRIRHGNVTV